MSDSLMVSNFMPAMTIEEVATRRNQIVEFTKKAMVPDVDYGVVPGTTTPTLLKPGAEKLCTLFGLSPRFSLFKSVEDWTGKDFNGEPFFYYLYHVQLYRGDYLVGEGEGSCNSRESKYRYRKAERVCPVCNQSAIIKGRQEFGGGWVCFTKKGGCGEKFGEQDPRITGQQVGRIVNEDVADQANTILKMAQKRALIAATLIAVNASEFFTQDMEDMVIDGTFREADKQSEQRAEVKLVGEQRSDNPDSPLKYYPDKLAKLQSVLKEHGYDTSISKVELGVVHLVDTTQAKLGDISLARARLLFHYLKLQDGKKVKELDGTKELGKSVLARSIATGETWDVALAAVMANQIKPDEPKESLADRLG